MKFKYLLLLCLIILSCDSDDNESINDPGIENIVGFYTIQSFESDLAVDLNGDGISSTDLKSEINDFFYYDLEIRPNIEGQTRVQLISFILPATNLRFQNPSYPNGYTSFTSNVYLSMYKLVDNQILLESNSFNAYDYVDGENRITTLKVDSFIEVLGNNSLAISMTEDYYDYSTAQWQSLNIDVVYEKLNFVD